MSWFVTNFIAVFLLPPLSLLLVLALGIFLLHRRRKFAMPLLLAAFGLLWIASTPYFAEGALHLLESRVTVLDSQRQRADAIVILGGGKRQPQLMQRANPVGIAVKNIVIHCAWPEEFKNFPDCR